MRTRNRSICRPIGCSEAQSSDRGQAVIHIAHEIEAAGPAELAPGPCPARATAILLAGERRGDPLAQWAEATAKSLVRVAGQPMAVRVIDTLVDSGLFGAIRVLSQDSASLAAHLAPFLPAGAPITFHDSADGIAETLAALVAAADGPLLVTTSDHVLLTPDMLRVFLSAAAGADLATGLVERRVLLDAYPQARRTWLTFRGGAYSGANLFWIGSARALPLIELWRTVERDRKRGWKVIGAFGPLALIGALLGMLSLERAFARVGRRFGIDVRPVVLATAEACIDVDTVADLRLAEQILFQRGVAAAAPLAHVGG